MKLPGSDWVHPWARPSRDSQVIRLSRQAQPPAPVKPERERLAEEITGARAARPRLRRDVYPGILDALSRSKRDRAPDPLVFGPQRELLCDPGWEALYCAPCSVGWSVYNGTKCWNCGGT